MEEYRVAVTTKLNGNGVVERMVTVRADSVEEAEALYRQALARLEEWDSQVGGNGSEAPNQAPNGGADARATQPQKQGATAITEPALSRVEGARCPQHGKAAQGKYGLYCPTKLQDGSWCKWRPAKANGGSASGRSR